MWKNTNTAYGLGTKLLHWVIGLTIIGLLAVGLYMADLPPTDTNKYIIYGWHKSFGIAVLILMFGRLCWRVYNTPVASHTAHAPWEQKLAKIIHIALYVAAIAMPLSGWAMSSAGGHPVGLFSLPIPALMEKNEMLGGFFNEVHEYLGWTLIALISLHVIGALKHHFLDKDDTLCRMLIKGDKH